jgi:hypothetical protein
MAVTFSSPIGPTNWVYDSNADQDTGAVSQGIGLRATEANEDGDPVDDAQRIGTGDTTDILWQSNPANPPD